MTTNSALPVDRLLTIVADIYDSARDPVMMPQALQRLVDWLNTNAVRLQPHERPGGAMADSQALEKRTARGVEAVDNHRRRQAHTERRAPERIEIEAVLRALPVPCLLLDRMGRLLSRNLAADNVLHEAGMSMPNPFPCFDTVEDRQLWNRAVHGATYSHRAQVLEIRGRAGGPWKLHVLPFGAVPGRAATTSEHCSWSCSSGCGARRRKDCLRFARDAA